MYTLEHVQRNLVPSQCFLHHAVLILPPDWMQMYIFANIHSHHTSDHFDESEREIIESLQLLGVAWTNACACADGYREKTSFNNSARWLLSFKFSSPWSIDHEEGQRNKNDLCHLIVNLKLTFNTALALALSVSFRIPTMRHLGMTLRLPPLRFQ